MAPWVLWLACAVQGGPAPEASPAPPVASSSAAPSTAPAAGGVLTGLCEASTLAPWQGGWIVGDNEITDRLFRFDAALAPAGTYPLTTPVDDIEGLSVVGDRVLLTGSYSRNKDAELRPARAWTGYAGESGVVMDLESGCAPCRVARMMAPELGGLNLEGIAQMGGSTWLGARSPIVDGKALLLEVRGGPEVGRVAGMVPLDLGGRGVRELVPYRSGLLVLAGPAGSEEAPHRVYWLSGAAAAPVDLGVELPASTEGIAVDGASLLYVTDGDGKKEPCKVPARWGRVPFTPPA